MPDLISMNMALFFKSNAKVGSSTLPWDKSRHCSFFAFCNSRSYAATCAATGNEPTCKQHGTLSVDAVSRNRSTLQRTSTIDTRPAFPFETWIIVLSILRVSTSAREARMATRTVLSSSRAIATARDPVKSGKDFRRRNSERLKQRQADYLIYSCIQDTNRAHCVPTVPVRLHSPYST